MPKVLWLVRGGGSQSMGLDLWDFRSRLLTTVLPGLGAVRRKLEIVQ